MYHLISRLNTSQFLPHSGFMFDASVIINGHYMPGQYSPDDLRNRHTVFFVRFKLNF
jgi:hypothetical protein